jgi:RNA polymerase sigma-70 factor (ECF subfamily)
MMLVVVAAGRYPRRIAHRARDLQDFSYCPVMLWRFAALLSRRDTPGGRVRVDDERGWFTRPYVQLHPQVLAYAWRHVGADRAHEVTDETFLIAWRRRAVLPEPALPWLLVTARNVMRHVVRKDQRTDALAVELARTAAVAEQAGAEVVAIERINVRAALASLSEDDREALLLSVWDGLTNRQGAEMVKCSVPAFAVRLHRARRRFAAALERADAALLADKQTRGLPTGLPEDGNDYSTAPCPAAL